MKSTYKAQILKQKKDLKSKQELHMMVVEAVENAMNECKKKCKE